MQNMGIMKNHSVLVIAFGLTLSACSNEQVTNDLKNFEVCMDIPYSIQKTFDDAKSEKRSPIYLHYNDNNTFAETDWYKEHETFFTEYYSENEDWSGLIQIDQCESILQNLESQFSSNNDVKSARELFDFVDHTITTYGSTHLEYYMTSYASNLEKTRKCLLRAYPQVFESPNSYHSFERNSYFPNLFHIPWDGETATVSGRDYLNRPIQTIEDTGCLDNISRYSKSSLNANKRLYDTQMNLEYYELINWDEAFVKGFQENILIYNRITNENHKDLKDSGAILPAAAEYSPGEVFIFLDGTLFHSSYVEKKVIECEQWEPVWNLETRQPTTTEHQACSQFTWFCDEIFESNISDKQNQTALAKSFCDRVDKKRREVFPGQD